MEQNQELLNKPAEGGNKFGTKEVILGLGAIYIGGKIVKGVFNFTKDKIVMPMVNNYKAKKEAKKAVVVEEKTE